MRLRRGRRRGRWRAREREGGRRERGGGGERCGRRGIPRGQGLAGIDCFASAEALLELRLPGPDRRLGKRDQGHRTMHLPW